MRIRVKRLASDCVGQFFCRKAYRNNSLRKVTVLSFQRLLSASAEMQVPVALFNFVQRLTKDSELIVLPKNTQSDTR
ncbi:hypothetical protein, partial [Bacillus cereus]|uniref:hypothetical protein n=1 Tax=Bacillus cereus TaxID=1396 RepID=UPI003D65B1CC